MQNLRRVLIIFSLITLLAPLAFGGVCTTPACHRLAKFLKRQIDAAADPCENFYNFACGKYVKDNPLSLADQFELFAEQSHADLEQSGRAREIAESIIKNVTDAAFGRIDENDPKTPNAVRYAKRYYDACVKWDPTSQAAQDNIMAYIRDFAAWPLLNPYGWHEDAIDYIEVVARLIATHQVDTVVSLKIDADVFDTSRNTLFLNPASFSFDVDQMNETRYPRFRTQYRQTIVRAFKTLVLNAGVSVAGGQVALKQLAQDIVDFEADLAEHTVPEQMMRQDSIEQLKQYYHPYTVSEMNNVYNNKKIWNKFFRTVFRNETEGLDWIKNKTNKIIVTQEPFFQFLATKYATTKKETIGNYLLWKLVQALGSAMGENYYDVTGADQSTRRKLVNDAPVERPNEDCFSEVQEHYQDAVTRVYVDERFHDDKAEAAETLAKDLVDAARRIFKANTWLSSKAKDRVLNKLDNLILGVGYPKWIKDKRQLDSHYEKWKAVPEHTTYFENKIRFSKWNYKRLMTATDRYEFLTEPTLTGNAFYAPWLNSLSVPAGTFEYPYFDAGYPLPYKYGLLGTIFGHEIFHGFDNKGVLYDAFGNNSASVALGGSWTLEGSYDKFVNKSGCIVQEYAKGCYVIPDEPKELSECKPGDSVSDCHSNPTPSIEDDLGSDEDSANKTEPTNTTMCIDGDYSLGENLADFNGIHASWSAYQAAQKASKEDIRLPGLEEYNADQLFFIAWSVFWCEPYHPAKIAYLLLADVHSPNDARVNMAVSQMPTFGETFNCKKNQDPMYPKNVCSVY